MYYFILSVRLPFVLFLGFVGSGLIGRRIPVRRSYLLSVII
jgi:hypothetical protein